MSEREWTRVRIAASDGPSAMAALCWQFSPVLMRVDTSPQGAGAQWQLDVLDHAAQQVVALFERFDVGVLGVEALDVATAGDDGAMVRARRDDDELAPPDRKRSAYHNHPHWR